MSPKSKSSKEPLQRWLRDKIDSGRFSGLQWTDKKSSTFQVPWLNQKSHGWSEKDSEIFVEYAKHTDKIQPGEKKFPKYKQNFKSAVNKNRFIKRLDSPNQKSFRLFSFIDCDSKKIEKGGLSCCEKNERQEKLSADQLDGADRMKVKQLNLQETQVVNGPLILTQPMDERATILTDFLLKNVSPIMGCHADGAEGNDEIPQQENLNLVDLNETFPQMVSSQMVSSQNHGKNQIYANFMIAEPEKLNQIDSMLIPSFLQSMVIDSTTTHGADNCVNSDAINEGLINQTLEQDANISSMAAPDVTGSDELPNFDWGIIGETVNKHVVDLSAQTLSGPSCETQSSFGSLSSMDTSEDPISLDGKEASRSNSVTSLISAESPTSQAVSMIAPDLLEKGLIRLHVHYGTPDRDVMTEIVSTDRCRIFFGKVDNKRIQQEIELRDDAQQIELPSVDSMEFKDKSKSRINDILQRMDLGVLLIYRNHDIYVVRRCQPHVFLSDGVSSSKKLPRSSIKSPDQEILAFSFNDFENSIKCYKDQNQKNVIGRCNFMLTFGCEIQPNDLSPTKVIPVFIIVEHVLAGHIRCKTLGPKASEPVPTYSMSDSFDNLSHFSNRFGF